MNTLEEIQMAIIVRLKTQRDDLREEVERLRERLAAAEAVIAEHDRARATVSPPPCACAAHIAWREVRR